MTQTFETEQVDIKCVRKRNRNECKSWHDCKGWMHVTKTSHNDILGKFKKRKTKTHPNLPEPRSALCRDFILSGLNGNCCLVSCPVNIQTKWPLNRDG